MMCRGADCVSSFLRDSGLPTFEHRAMRQSCSGVLLFRFLQCRRPFHAGDVRSIRSPSVACTAARIQRETHRTNAADGTIVPIIPKVTSSEFRPAIDSSIPSQFHVSHHISYKVWENNLDSQHRHFNKPPKQSKSHKTQNNYGDQISEMPEQILAFFQIHKKRFRSRDRVGMTSSNWSRCHHESIR